MACTAAFSSFKKKKKLINHRKQISIFSRLLYCFRAIVDCYCCYCDCYLIRSSAAGLVVVVPESVSLFLSVLCSQIFEKKKQRKKIMNWGKKRGPRRSFLFACCQEEMKNSCEGAISCMTGVVLF